MYDHGVRCLTLLCLTLCCVGQGGGISDEQENNVVKVEAFADEHAISSQRIGELQQENAKLKLDLALASVRIGELNAKLEIANTNAVGGSQFVGDFVATWLAVLSTPACLIVYMLSHRSKMFQKLKYGKNCRY